MKRIRLQAGNKTFVTMGQVYATSSSTSTSLLHSMMPRARTALRSTLESISAFRRARNRSSGVEEEDVRGNDGLVRVDGVASSSQVAEGRGTEVASNETRLLLDDSRGRLALNLPASDEEEVAVEESDDARTRVAMLVKVV